MGTQQVDNARDINKIIQHILDRAATREERIEELNRQYDELETEYRAKIDPIRDELESLGNKLRFRTTRDWIAHEIINLLQPEIEAIEKQLAGKDGVV